MKTAITLLFVLLCAAPAFAQADLEVTAEDMYYEARGLLREGEYLGAADGFGTVAEEHRDSSLAPKALYWRAFALSREGERSNLIEAKNSLEMLYDRYPAEARRGDSAELAIEIRGRLAQLGDADAAREITALAEAIRGERSSERDDGPDDAERDRGDMSEETRLAALNALLQMSPERAMPILRKILVEQPDKYSDEFRERAVFLLSQNDSRSDETLATFEHVIDNDRSRDVREQAVFWLSQTHDERAVDILEGIARDSDADPAIRDKAIFALSQVGGSRASEILRDVAMDSDTSTELRAQAVFWIGQTDDRSAFEFLEQLYRGVENDEIKDKAIFSISQLGGPRAVEFFESIVRDTDESIDLRKQAFFWMGQMGGDDVDVDVILELFRTVDDREVREQAVFVLSQLGRGRGVDALIDIARNADDQDLREKAIFWLGQSDDDRALDYLADLIEEEF